MKNKKQPPDKFRTDADNRKAHFVLLDSSFEPPFDQVTSVSLVPFTDDGNVVVVVEKRGPDLPGGHVKVGERKPEETARREAFEELSITLKELQTVRAIQSDYYGNVPEKLTYMVIMTGLVDTFQKIASRKSQRLILTKEQFIQQYLAGDKNMMEQLVSDAYQIVFPEGK